MAMIFSGSDGYEDPLDMFYAQKDGKNVRLEIYATSSTDMIVKMYRDAGWVVTTARETPQDVSNKFSELHSFKNWPR